MKESKSTHHFPPLSHTTNIKTFYNDLKFDGNLGAQNYNLKNIENVSLNKI